MQRNVGKRDGQLRVVFGVAFLILAVLFNTAHFVAFAAGIVAVALIGTGLTRRCPAYTAFGITTCSPDEQARHT